MTVLVTLHLTVPTLVTLLAESSREGSLTHLADRPSKKKRKRDAFRIFLFISNSFKYNTCYKNTCNKNTCYRLIRYVLRLFL